MCKSLFSVLLAQCTMGLNPLDLARICIQAVGLDKPISTCLMTVQSLTIEKVLAVVMKVLQSKDEIKLDEGFSADVITIRRDVGAGRRKVCNVKVDRLQKKSVLAIAYDDEGMCCGKAIACALAHLDEDKAAIKSFGDSRRPALLHRKALELYEAAGVEPGPCSYSEIAKFEDYLNVQIAVISLENMNKVIS